MTQKQLQDAQNLLEQTQKQLREAQEQVALLEAQKNQLVSQLTLLDVTCQRLRKKVYAGYDLVQQAKALLNKITLNAPQVNDTWTFVRTYTYMEDPLPSNYFNNYDLSLYSYQTIEVSTSEPLYIAFFTPDQFDAWDKGSVIPLASGRGYVKFTPPNNGTYVLVINNDLGRDVDEFQITYRYSETWHYYDIVPPKPVTPYVVGTPDTSSRDFFRLFAIYNYWLRNRHQLADEVVRQLNSQAFSPQQQLKLYTRTLYALSLAALLTDAGFDVSLAAIGTRWDDPFNADSIVPVVRFHSRTDPNATFSDMLNKIKMGWMNFVRKSLSSYVGYDFYVIIDTYNVDWVVDRQLDMMPFNVIYIDGLTKLPEQ